MSRVYNINFEFSLKKYMNIYRFEHDKFEKLDRDLQYIEGSLPVDYNIRAKKIRKVINEIVPVDITSMVNNDLTDVQYFNAVLDMWNRKLRQ